MTKIILRLVLFLSPFLFISLVVGIVDPYNLLNISHAFSDEVKIKVLNRSNSSIPRGNTLWKAIDFRRNPTPNIILGDSKVAYMSNEQLTEALGKPTYNLGSAGFNYRSVIDLFWLAAESTQLENVIIQANFYSYNIERNSYNLFTPVDQVLRKPYSYFYHWDYLKDSFAVLYYAITKDEEFVSRGFQRTDDNWLKSYKILENEFVRDRYVYPQSVYSGLEKIADYCYDNDINLVFIIPPDYYEVYDYIEIANLTDKYSEFLEDFYDLGTTIEYNEKFPKFAKNSEFFADHFHVKSEYTDTLVSLLFPKDIITLMK